jgi:hypothetical protein
MRHAAALCLLLLSKATFAGPIGDKPLGPAALVDKADVLRVGLTGLSVTAVHTVADTEGRTEKQAYRVLNQLSSGSSFIVLSSENPEVNGLVYLIKGNVLYAATPNQRSFQRLGGLNLGRRISGSLFSHWDLQGNLPLSTEYAVSITSTAGASTTGAQVLLEAKPDAHYQKIEATLDRTLGLFTSAALHDPKGLLKTVAYSRPKTLGSKQRRKVMTQVEVTRAPGRTDQPVAKTTFRLLEVEFDPAVTWAEELATTDANLAALRAKYVLSGEALRALLAEADES